MRAAHSPKTASFFSQRQNNFLHLGSEINLGAPRRFGLDWTGIYGVKYREAAAQDDDELRGGGGGGGSA